jgi:hypothetical protein
MLKRFGIQNAREGFSVLALRDGQSSPETAAAEGDTRCKRRAIFADLQDEMKGL